MASKQTAIVDLSKIFSVVSLDQLYRTTHCLKAVVMAMPLSASRTFIRVI